MSVGLVCILGVLLDARWGGWPTQHFWRWFNRYTTWLETHFNAVTGRGWRSHGVSAWALAVLPAVLLVYGLARIPYWGWWLELLVLYWALGLKSLSQQALSIAQALRLGDVAGARQALAELLGRPIAASEAESVAASAAASVLERGACSVLACLFWFALLGAPGVMLYRLSLALDALWGYRDERYVRFGWAAARIFDALIWLPVRLTAMTYALLGHTGKAARCWQQQARHQRRSRTGMLIAAGAGAMQLRLSDSTGDNHGLSLGDAHLPRAQDIERALNYLYASVALWLLLLVSAKVLGA